MRMVYSVDKRESKRITCLRALCVVLVIFLHQYAGDLGDVTFAASGTIPKNVVFQGIQYIISRIITFSAVPIFFMLSSVLLYAKEFTWKSNMKKKLKSLVLPYILWITLYIFMYFLGQTFPMTSGFFANAGRKVRDMSLMDFIGAYTGIGGHGLFVNALWFIRDLVIMNLVAPVLKRAIDEFPLICLVLIAVLWNVGSIPECLILNKLSVVFFALGYYIVKYGFRMRTIDKLSTAGIIFIYVVMVTIEFCFYKEGSDLRKAAHSFTIIIGIVLLIKLSGLIIRKSETNVPQALITVASYSFFVYASHDFVQTVLKKVADHTLPQTDFIQMIEYFLIPFLVCFICVVAGILVNKLLPPVYGIMTGARKQRTYKEEKDVITEFY